MNVAYILRFMSAAILTALLLTLCLLIAIQPPPTRALRVSLEQFSEPSNGSLFSISEPDRFASQIMICGGVHPYESQIPKEQVIALFGVALGASFLFSYWHHLDHKKAYSKLLDKFEIPH
jgi:hypothetical protein